MTSEEGGKADFKPPWENLVRNLDEDEPPRDPRRLVRRSTAIAMDLVEHHLRTSQPVRPEPPKLRKSRTIAQLISDPDEDQPSPRVKRERSRHHARPATPPAEKVKFILGLGGDDGQGQGRDGQGAEGHGHQPHPLFLEMEELFVAKDGNLEWKETARWLKFEEDVEDGGDRWSKPHVATLNLQTLLELRSNLRTGTICLDIEADNLEDIADICIDYMVQRGQLPYDKREFVKDAIMKKHRHQYEGSGSRKESGSQSFPVIRSLIDIARGQSFGKGLASQGVEDNNGSSAKLTSSPSKMNMHFMKKIPKDAEAANVLVGELAVLEKPISCFIRLNKAVQLGDLTEVPLPTRFIYICLGPPDKKGDSKRYHELGRSLATLLSDQIYLQLAYKATKRGDLLVGLDEFLGVVTVIPPGEWDPSIRIEPPDMVPSQEGRGNPYWNMSPPEDEDEVRKKELEESGLIRSGRLFGGLINDVKRKTPWYWSDFKDAFNLQCVASLLYVYIAVLAPVITFGGLLGDATEQHIAVIEALIGGMMIGVAYGFFSGQPLTILGPTGPILVFETIVYQMCQSFEWNFLPFRLWIAVWVGFYLLIGVATDASALVRFITRFTEENFAFLIAVIFIKSSFEKLFSIAKTYPLQTNGTADCSCIPLPYHPSSLNLSLESFPSFVDSSHHTIPGTPCLVKLNGTTFFGVESEACHPPQNVLLMSVILFFGTFFFIMVLKAFRGSSYFPTAIRSIVADFSVIIAVIMATGIDMAFQVETPKLSIPSTFQPSQAGRSWIVEPFGGNPWWTSLAASVPALLATILVFMDQQITVVIVNRKEHKLLKGCGYHLDLFIVAIMVILCGVFGFPFCEGSTVPSIVHVKSLKKESECSAPGEKPRFLGIREQRVTHIVVFLFVGLSVLLTPLLSLVPMPVLFGVFLYMGIASLDGLQFFDRLCLVFMPNKYQPDLTYLRRVPIGRIHLFTAIQLFCFAVLWAVKDIKQTSILFPIMLAVMVGVRKVLDYVFSKEELRILDDVFPSFKRTEQLNDEDNLTKAESMSMQFTKRENFQLPTTDGRLMRIEVRENINVTEEMEKSDAWKSIEAINRRRKHRKNKLILLERDKVNDDDEGGIHMKSIDEKDELNQ